jgi:phage-related protein
MSESNLMPVAWIGSSRRDLCKLPDDVQDDVGYALYFAQQGRHHPSAKVLHGFGGAGVLEVVADDAGGTYRAVYTVRFAQMVYVLHVFQKRSKKGIRTPAKEIDLVKRRLVMAAAHYQEHRHEFENLQANKTRPR